VALPFSPTKEPRSALQLCDLPADHYFTHRFHIGAATIAAAEGVPSWLIKVLGRWSSDCYEHYNRTPQETLLVIARKLVMDNSNVVIQVYYKICLDPLINYVSPIINIQILPTGLLYLLTLVS